MPTVDWQTHTKIMVGDPGKRSIRSMSPNLILEIAYYFIGDRRGMMAPWFRHAEVLQVKHGQLRKK